MTNVTVTPSVLFAASYSAWNLTREWEARAGASASAQVRLWGKVGGGLCQEYALQAAAASWEAQKLLSEAQELEKLLQA